MFEVLALLAAAEVSTADVASAASIAKAVDYTILESAEDPTFCQGSNTQFDALSDVRSVICADKPTATISQLRSSKHRNARSWTVRMDELQYSSAEQAARVQQGLLALAKQPSKDELQLSWCPRSYFWSGSTLWMISTACGAQKPFSEVSHAMSIKVEANQGRTPTGILGGEGGSKAIVATSADIDAFGQCAATRK